jgi:hypothetical protein
MFAVRYAPAMRLALVGLALGIAIGASACVSELSGTVERRCPESAVELHAEQTGLAYPACGSLELVEECAVSEGFEPSVEQREALECFGSALAACSPARLDLRSMTEEGGTVWTIHLVEPDGRGACRITVLIDDRGDPLAERPGISRVFCDDPELGTGCPVLASGTCSEPSPLCVAGKVRN